jgi:hypothetical protein
MMGVFLDEAELIHMMMMELMAFCCKDVLGGALKKPVGGGLMGQEVAVVLLELWLCLCQHLTSS